MKTVNNMTLNTDSAFATINAQMQDKMPAIPCNEPSGFTYVGARYVVKFHNPLQWNNENTYESLEVVINEGNSYVSRKPVPTGVDISNTDYWIKAYDFNAQVELLRQDMHEVSVSYVKIYNNVAEMKADTDIEAGMIVATAGYWQPGDAGAAIYVISESGNADDREVYALQGNLYAEMLTPNFVTPEMFGNDFSYAINYCQSNSRELIVNNTYTVGGTMVMNGLNMRGCGTIVYNGTSTLMMIDSQCRIEGLTIQRPAWDTTVDGSKAIEISGGYNYLKNLKISNFSIGMLLTNTTQGCVYNYITDCHTEDCMQSVKLLSANTGWVNENAFYNHNARFATNLRNYIATLENHEELEALYAIELNGTIGYAHPCNSNKFIGCNIEGPYNGFYANCSQCLFLGCRTEGCTTMYNFELDEINTGDNVVISNYPTLTEANVKQSTKSDDNPLTNTFIGRTTIPLYIPAGLSFAGYTSDAPSTVKFNSGNIAFDAKSAGTPEIKWGDNYLSFEKTRTYNLVIPYGSTAGRPADPATGELFFDYSLKKLLIYNGGWYDCMGTAV